MAGTSGLKQCICGRSSRFPICDGSHVSEAWTCVPDGDDLADIVFLASPHLRNLADRLAHRFCGISAHASDSALRTHKLVILTNGVGTLGMNKRRSEITAHSTLVVGIGLESAALQWAFSDAEYRSVAAEPTLNLWSRVLATLTTEEAPSRLVEQRPRIFISHGVKDEPIIYPILTILREQYGLELFVCADSIDAGSSWQQEITSHLRRCDVFLVIASHTVAQSLFCAFEAGMAVALDKPIRIVKLDDSKLPLHLQDRQSVDVRRLMQRKPWLTQADAVLDACITAITGGQA
jgi:hypothetical protein